MTDLYDFTFRRVFAAYLHGEASFLAQAEAFSGPVTLQDQGLTFTLPGLFDLVRQLCAEAGSETPPGTRGDYLRFRAALYRNQTNSQLKPLGGRVVLAAGHEDHDQSLYRLERVPPDP